MPVAEAHAGGGPVYFAWVGPTETEFLSEHIRYDEYIFRFDITIEENQLPVATIEMKNPGALLASGRERWARLAFDDASGVRQTFFGSIIAVPSDLFNQTITVQLIAKPLDYLERKVAAAEPLKADPDYYHKAFIDPKYWDDPDTIRQARSVAWHHDPVTHDVSVSDLLVGEAGEQEFFAADVIKGSVKFSIGEAPKSVVKVDASVVWTQTATGTIDLPYQVITSYTGKDVLSAWPKPTDSLEGGWSVESSSAVDVGNTDKIAAITSNYSWQNKAKEHANGDAMSVNESYNGPAGGFHGGNKFNLKTSESFTIGDPETGRAAARSIQQNWIVVYQYTVRGELTLRYNAKRDRTEHLRFTLTAGQQAILTDLGGTDDIETLTLTGCDVGQPLGDDPAPIGDLARKTFFPFDVHAQHYALNVGRAHIVQGSRVATASFDCRSFRRALALTLKMNVILHNPDLPGGVMTGKITKVVLSGDGSSGSFKGNVTIGAAAGTAAALEAVTGTPTYADADVLGPDVQVFENRYVVLGTGAILYPPPVDQVNDDGLVFPLTYNQAVVRYEVMTEGLQTVSAGSPGGFGSGTTPGATLGLAQQAQSQQDAVIAGLSNKSIWVELELKPVDNGPFEDEFVFNATMSLPKQIDLSAG